MCCPPPGEVAGVLCAVGGEGMCREVLPYITGGIEGNLERDSGEVDTQLTQKLSQSSSSSSPENSHTEDRTERVSNLGCSNCTVCVVVYIVVCTYFIAYYPVHEYC